MLVLSRKKDQTLVIDRHIRITVLEMKGRTVRLGIEAPRDVGVWRGELELNAEAGTREPLPMVVRHLA